MVDASAAAARPRIALLEEHALFAESLAFVLGVNGYDVRRIPPPVGSSSVTSVLPLVIEARPRLALIDLDLGPLGSGVRLIEPLVQAQIPVLAVTATPDRVQWGECIRDGASQVLPKSAPLQQILASVRRITQGLPVMSPVERGALVGLWHEHRAERHGLRHRLERLTTREQEVLGHLMSGRTVREIASIGVVSEATVRTQVKSILAKLEVSSQVAAVGIAHRARWRPRPRRTSR